MSCSEQLGQASWKLSHPRDLGREMLTGKDARNGHWQRRGTQKRRDCGERKTDKRPVGGETEARSGSQREKETGKRLTGPGSRSVPGQHSDWAEGTGAAQPS